MKLLFIGGTGVISTACAELAMARGAELYLLNRGQSHRPTPPGAHLLRADIRDLEQARAATRGLAFDAVVNWVAFEPEHVAADIALFRGRVGQYVFISSASVYQKPIPSLPITESTLIDNAYWDYARAKIACEELLVGAYRSEHFPVTIVRPSHTYDHTKLPTPGGYTAIARMRQGKPVIVHGDGASLWVLTYHRDFAKGFVGLLGNQRAVGEAFHITSDELLTWDHIYRTLARAAGVEATLVHAPSELISEYDPVWGAGLLGDKAHSVVFDNSKIKRFVPDFAPSTPFSRGALEVIAWHDADPSRQIIDPAIDRAMDDIVQAMARARSRSVAGGERLP